MTEETLEKANKLRERILRIQSRLDKREEDKNSITIYTDEPFFSNLGLKIRELREKQLQVYKDQLEAL